MKCILITVLVIFGSSLYGQTDSIEKASIYNKMASKEIEQEEFLKTWQSWKQKMKEIKQYPNLPLDQSGKVHYSFVNIFKDYDKEKLFYRTLEWLSINYGLIPAYIYSNVGAGKIIFRNSLDLNTGSSCNYTSVISIKNEKIMTEYISIAYQTFTAAHYVGDIWIPDKTVDLDISQVYPIVLKKPSEWNANLNLLKITNELFIRETKNLFDYIETYDSLYMF